MVAANLALRQVGLPSQILWDQLLGREVNLQLMEDNTATLQIMLSGKSPNLRHVSRTHGVNLLWVHERVSGRTGPDAAITADYCKTHEMAADIFTKEFRLLPQWQHALSLIGIRPKGTSTDWGRLAEPIKKKNPKLGKEGNAVAAWMGKVFVG